MGTIYILFENYEVWSYSWHVEGYTTNESLAQSWVSENSRDRKYEATGNQDMFLFKKYGIEGS